VKLTAYILTKNEETNIENCLLALKQCGIPVIVLDSRSTDRTREIAQNCGCSVELYDYRDHLGALRYLCEDRTSRDGFCLVLDADMIVSPKLLSEAHSLLVAQRADVALAPVTMFWNGSQLKRGSLYPPKPFMFRGGSHYFEALGHGEVLLKGVRSVLTNERLIHNDQKSFEAFLDTQVRYSKNLVRRRLGHAISWRDRLRSTPLFMIGAPFFSLLVKGGILSGKVGLGYAVDRLLAEAIMYRQGLVARVDAERSKK
jgi:glycosyltransferase involved in cell wall biosynthesis